MLICNQCGRVQSRSDARYCEVCPSTEFRKVDSESSSESKSQKNKTSANGNTPASISKVKEKTDDQNPALSKLRARVEWFRKLALITVVVCLFASFIVGFQAGTSMADGSTVILSFIASWASQLWIYALVLWFISTFFLWSTEAIVIALEKPKI